MKSALHTNASAKVYLHIAQIGFRVYASVKEHTLRVNNEPRLPAVASGRVSRQKRENSMRVIKPQHLPPARGHSTPVENRHSPLPRPAAQCAEPYLTQYVVPIILDGKHMKSALHTNAYAKVYLRIDQIDFRVYASVKAHTVRINNAPRLPAIAKAEGHRDKSGKTPLRHQTATPPVQPPAPLRRESALSAPPPTAQRAEQYLPQYVVPVIRSEGARSQRFMQTHLSDYFPRIHLHQSTYAARK